METYSENGQLMLRENYKDGKQDGLWESFYENGQPKEKSNYKEGELDGLREVYEPGYLKHKTNYVMGKRNGPHERYFDNGVIIEKGNYTNNQRTGIWYERWTEPILDRKNKPYFDSRVDCGRYGYNREPYGYLQFLDPDTGEEESRTKLHYSTYRINCVE